MASDSSLSDLSSELSSIGSLSPVPDYPSPISSQEQDLLNGVSAQIPRKHKLESEEQPAPKKRKRAEPKPRTTEYLDLSSRNKSPCEQQKELDILLKVLRKRRKIVVVAGAGISVSAGIPDFRSSTGLFKSLKSEHKLKASGKQLFDASVYQTDSSTSSFHDMVRSMSKLVSEAKPTAFHDLLSDLGIRGQLLRLYTQNVDGLDIDLPGLGTEIPLNMKGPWPPTIQLHGGLAKMSCAKCNIVANFDAALFNGPEPPPCETCVEADRVRTDHAGKRSHGIGRLRPRMVLYNEHNPDQDAIGSVVSADLRARPDAVIVVGTSMKIPGVRRIVREMCGVVRSRRDGLAIWINRDGPPPGKEFEDCWDLVVKGPCDEVANQFRLSHYPQHKECSTSDIESAKEKGDLQVMVPSPKKPAVQILTPAASPAPKHAELKRKITIKLKVSSDGPEDTKAPTALKAGKSKNPSKAPPKPKSKSTSTKKFPSHPKQPSTKLTSAFKLTKPSAATTTAAAASKAKLPFHSGSGSQSPTPKPKPHFTKKPSSSKQPPPSSSPVLPAHKASRPSTPSRRQKQKQRQSPLKLAALAATGSLFPNLKLPAIDFSSKPVKADPLTPPGSRGPGLVEGRGGSENKDRRAGGGRGEERGPGIGLGMGRGIQVQIGRRISSSPPPYSPLSSPLLGAAADGASFLLEGSGDGFLTTLEEGEGEVGEENAGEGIIVPTAGLGKGDRSDSDSGRGRGRGWRLGSGRSRDSVSSVGSAGSRGSGGSRYEAGTVSPTSVPRGMEGLLCS